MKRFPRSPRFGSLAAVIAAERGPSVLLLAVLAAALTAGTAAAAERTEWKTGQTLHRQMQAVIGLSWPDNPLRDSIRRLSEDQGVAMLLDRNVDPHKLVTVLERGTSLEQTIEHLADNSGLDCCFVGPVVYFAPPQVAGGAVLAAVRDEEVGRLPAAVAARLAQRRATSWEILSEPRKLVEQAAAEYGVRIVGLERIPHDLWPEAELPPLTLAERLTLLLAGFHLTFEWSPDGTAIRLIDVDDTATVTRTYVAAGNAASALAELRREFPKAGVERATGGIRITADLDQHVAIERILRGGREAPAVAGAGHARPPTAEEKTYSLEIANKPAGAVVTAVAKENGWELRIAPGTEAQLRMLVSFKVEGVSLDDLMARALDPVGLSWRVEDGKLEIFHKQ